MISCMFIFGSDIFFASQDSQLSIVNAGMQDFDLMEQGLPLHDRSDRQDISIDFFDAPTFLLARDASIMYDNLQLFSAIKEKDHKAMSSLICQSHSDCVYYDNQDGKTLLCAAAEYGNVRAVSELLNHYEFHNGCDFNDLQVLANMPDKHGSTPLLYAVIQYKNFPTHEHISCVLQLLRAGAQVDRRNRAGISAQSFAEQHEVSSVLELFAHEDESFCIIS